MPDIDIKFTDNSRMTLDLFHKACARGLVAIGMTAEGHAKKITPVDTGRLRNSISHAETDDAVYIGTNVEYAPYVELGARGRKPVHMLKKAASEHPGEYKKLMKDSLENA